jgi:hypothetical protein
LFGELTFFLHEFALENFENHSQKNFQVYKGPAKKSNKNSFEHTLLNGSDYAHRTTGKIQKETLRIAVSSSGTTISGVRTMK